MNVLGTGSRLALGATAAALATSLLGVPAAQAGTTSAAAAKPLGKRSLVQVLTKDTKGFDHNGHDFDILTAAVKAVLKAKPKSPVKVLADGSTALTAFIPNDAAFRELARDLTGKRYAPSEKKAFGTIAGLGINTVESVLLYHVVPGATITGKTARKANMVSLTTAAGSKITVRVKVDAHKVTRVWLIDADKSDRNPRVVRFDINKGNRQIAHAIDRVLRPVNLP